LDLGFGGCKLQVQVPEKGDITEAKQLVGKNVVTSFTALSMQFFAGLEGVSDRGQALKTKIKYVGGSVEAACALGVADGIVDLVGMFCFPRGPKVVVSVRLMRTESGETMKAAGLKAIDTVVQSTAVLIKSKNTKNELVDLIASRIRGVIGTPFSRFLFGLIANDLQTHKNTSSANTTSPATNSCPPQKLLPASVRQLSPRSRKRIGSLLAPWLRRRRLPM
jgi:ATP phosphoribosyltransferase